MGRPITATRERILPAAYARFAGYGFRRTSMEDIAAAAGVSRAALYLQFRNKEAIFRALSQQLHEQALAGATAAVQADGRLAERLRAAVEARSLRFVEIAYGSPHGAELLDESNRLCGDLAADTQRQFVALLARVFRRAAAAGEIDLAGGGVSANEAAELLAGAVAGLKGPGVSVDAYRRRVARLITLFVAGLQPAAM
ncbi:MAG: TetR/AcrR family transcriptional regulator, partial [Deltaproteobacteria bacterium]|nr:TetR/AcrR family transcriptional regulator [Deltaproteobacteria bacterium]